MSDIQNAPDVDPILDGQVEGDVGGASEAVETFDWSEYGDKHVKVTVSGEEIEVPLNEALAGYQRQADYTRKTQELAEQRQQIQFAAAIQQALDNDPASTIQLLQQHYGISAGQDPVEDMYVDPVEKQFQSLESRVRAFEEAQAMQELERTIQSLQSKYGEDFDANEVVAQALAHGSSDLEAVYKQIAFDRLWGRQRAESEFAAKKAAEEAAILEAKRSTGGIVAGGSSAQGATVGSGPITSLRDAYAAAKAQMGIS